MKPPTYLVECETDGCGCSPSAEMVWGECVVGWHCDLCSKGFMDRVPMKSAEGGLRLVRQIGESIKLSEDGRHLATVTYEKRRGALGVQLRVSAPSTVKVRRVE